VRLRPTLRRAACMRKPSGGFNLGPEKDYKSGVELLKARRRPLTTSGRMFGSVQPTTTVWERDVTGVSPSSITELPPRPRIRMRNITLASSTMRARALKRDYASAVVWFQRACSAGRCRRNDVLGRCFRYAQGVAQKTRRRGSSLHLKAAPEGVLEGQFSGLGCALSRGRCRSGSRTGIQVVPEGCKARATTRRPTTSPLFYETGRGVPQNKRESRFLVWPRRGAGGILGLGLDRRAVAGGRETALRAG